MTAPLPPLIADDREFEAWIEILNTKELRKAFDDHAKLAVREALERAASDADAMDYSPDGAIGKHIRAMIEELDK